MQRIPVIAGNWKMNTTPKEGVELASKIQVELAKVKGVQVIIAPPFTHLGGVGDVVRDGSIKLAAQNVYPKDSGAFTGEVSPVMLKGIG